MKRKKLVSLMLAILLLGTLLPVAALAAEGPEYTQFSGVPYFFAKGTPITISAKADGTAGATITWAGGSCDVPANTNVFGGGHDDDTFYPSSSITVNGGTVRNVLGGGLHKSHVGTSSVVVNGGNLVAVQGGGASSLTHDCGCTNASPWYSGDATLSPCRVDSASVTINGGAISSAVYGGGEGISYTGSATVNILAGDCSRAWVTAGGSNGHTGSGTVNISGGTVNIVQGVNRGSMNASAVNVTGGTVSKVYAGGETGDSGVTGTVAQAAVSVTGGTVTQLQSGTSGGVELGSAGDPGTTNLSVQYTEGTVTNVQGALAAPASYKSVKFVNVFNGQSVTVTVKTGGAASVPASMAGLIGWYTDPACSVYYNMNLPVTADLVLYGMPGETPSLPPVIIRPETYSVIFTDGLGGQVFADQVYEGLRAGDNTPGFLFPGGLTEWNGLTFLGWSPSLSSQVTGNVIYTAQWDGSIELDTDDEDAIVEEATNETASR